MDKKTYLGIYRGDIWKKNIQETHGRTYKRYTKNIQKTYGRTYRGIYGKKIYRKKTNLYLSI